MRFSGVRPEGKPTGCDPLGTAVQVGFRGQLGSNWAASQSNPAPHQKAPLHGQRGLADREERPLAEDERFELSDPVYEPTVFQTAALPLGRKLDKKGVGMSGFTTEA